MAETALDAGTEEMLEHLHRFAASEIGQTDGTSPSGDAAVDAGVANDQVFEILAGLCTTAVDLAYVHRGTATMVLDAATELGLTEQQVAGVLRKLTGLLE